MNTTSQTEFGKSWKHARPSLGSKWLMIAVLGSVTVVASATEDQPQRPIPPQANAYGLSLGELGTSYWQWMFSLPNTDHPAYEQGEVVSGLLNQPKHYFILESGYPQLRNRHVQIPAGKGILFTLDDGCWDNRVGLPGATVQELRAAVQNYYDTTPAFFDAELDGRPILVEDHFVISDPFELTIGDDGLFGYPAGISDAVVGGWIVLLPPLPVGEHTLHLHIDVPADSYLSDTTFHITVK